MKTEGLVVALLTWTSSTSSFRSRMSSFSFKVASLLFVVASACTHYLEISVTGSWSFFFCPHLTKVADELNTKQTCTALGNKRKRLRQTSPHPSPYNLEFILNMRIAVLSHHLGLLSSSNQKLCFEQVSIVHKHFPNVLLHSHMQLCKRIRRFLLSPQEVAESIYWNWRLNSDKGHHQSKLDQACLHKSDLGTSSSQA